MGRGSGGYAPQCPGGAAAKQRGLKAEFEELVLHKTKKDGCKPSFRFVEHRRIELLTF